MLTFQKSSKTYELCISNLTCETEDIEQCVIHCDNMCDTSIVQVGVKGWAGKHA